MAVGLAIVLERVREGSGMASKEWVPWIRRRRFPLLCPMDGLIRRRLIHATPQPRTFPYTLLVGSHCRWSVAGIVGDGDLFYKRASLAVNKEQGERR
jgi:hypothetical protein